MHSGQKIVNIMLKCSADLRFVFVCTYVYTYIHTYMHVIRGGMYVHFEFLEKMHKEAKHFTLQLHTHTHNYE